MKRAIDIEIQIGEEYVTRQSIELENAGHETLSPFDIPRHARLWYDEPNQRLHLEFRYLTPDEPKEELRVNRVVLNVGKISKKFYSLWVPDVAPEAPQFKAALDEIIEAFRARSEQYNVKSLKERMPFLNFSLARDFVTSKENDLLDLAL